MSELGSNSIDAGPRRQSPLVQFVGTPSGEPAAAGARGVECIERAFLGHLNLRGDAADAGFRLAVESVLGIALPTVPNTTACSGVGDDSTVVYWLGPDEWLIVLPAEPQVQQVAAELRAAFGSSNTLAALTDVSGGQTILVLRGPKVRALLSKECPLDFHASKFRPGQCAQTRIAKAPVLLRALGSGADGNGDPHDHDAFEIVIRRSFADYFCLWLKTAAVEYGFVDLASLAHPD